MKNGPVDLVVANGFGDQFNPLLQRHAGNQRVGDEGFVGNALQRFVRI